MCESIENLLGILYPSTEDLDEKIKELEETKTLVEEHKNIIEYINDEITKIINYEDQETIKKYFNDESKYQIATYLFKDNSLKNFSQYKEVYKYIKEIYDEMKENYPKIESKYENLTKECDFKKICLKYYKIMKNKKYNIENIDEFLTLLKSINITNQQKIEILSITIKNNIKYYNMEIKNEKEFKDLDILKIQKVLKDNKLYLNEKHTELKNQISKYVDFENSLQSIINKDLLYRFSIKDIINAKKAYLSNELTSNYKKGSFAKVNENIKEIEKVNYIENKIKEITDIDEILRRIKEV